MLCGDVLSVSEARFYVAVFKSSGVLVAISHCGVVPSMLRHYRQLHAVATSRRCGGDPISWRHPALQVATSFCGGVPSILWQSHIAAASGAYSGNFVLRRRPGSAAAILYCGGVPALVFTFHVAAATSCLGSIRSFLQHLHGVVASSCYGVPAVRWCPCATLVSLRYVGILASYYVLLLCVSSVLVRHMVRSCHVSWIRIPDGIYPSKGRCCAQPYIRNLYRNAVQTYTMGFIFVSIDPTFVSISCDARPLCSVGRSTLRNVSLSYDAMSHLSLSWCVGQSCHVIRSLFRPKSVGQIIDSVPVNGESVISGFLLVQSDHLQMMLFSHYRLSNHNTSSCRSDFSYINHVVYIGVTFNPRPTQFGFHSTLGYYDSQRNLWCRSKY
ncbi:13118_t:CDS:2 [Acaulospora morrowiae]|uniref:13118_t:CDS:1 n=1 Tax=Acaulospora morrowiae TaxID=94023 RepID=A0A9N9NC33_9GLOM|nr:13118_t:CDS:2 [Acaulospora morrowiae]